MTRCCHGDLPQGACSSPSTGAFAQTQRCVHGAVWWGSTGRSTQNSKNGFLSHQMTIGSMEVEAEQTMTHSALARKIVNAFVWIIPCTSFLFARLCVQRCRFTAQRLWIPFPGPGSFSVDFAHSPCVSQLGYFKMFHWCERGYRWLFTSVWACHKPVLGVTPPSPLKVLG